MDPNRDLSLRRSHASIIARSFGLPAVVGIPDLCELVSPERPIVVARLAANLLRGGEDRLLEHVLNAAVVDEQDVLEDEHQPANLFDQFGVFFLEGIH